MVKHRAGSIPALGTKLLIAGWSSLEARRAHNPEVVGSNPTPASIITLKLKWPHGQAVKTSPFHGGIPGSSPGGVTKKYGSIAQLGERLPYKQDVIGSSPITPTIIYLLMVNK